MGRRLVGDDVDNVLAHEPPGPAEEVLDPVVVVVGVEEEPPGHGSSSQPVKARAPWMTSSWV